jgi:hypothetical protein
MNEQNALGSAGGGPRAREVIEDLGNFRCESERWNFQKRR